MTKNEHLYIFFKAELGIYYGDNLKGSTLVQGLKTRCLISLRKSLYKKIPINPKVNFCLAGCMCPKVEFGVKNQGRVPFFSSFPPLLFSSNYKVAKLIISPGLYSFPLSHTDSWDYKCLTTDFTKLPHIHDLILY